MRTTLLVVALLAAAATCIGQELPPYGPAPAPIGPEPSCAGSALPPGAVLLSVNLDPYENRNPGFWNHSAIVATNGDVIESQNSVYGYGVQRVPFAQFAARPYRIAVLYPRDPALGQRAALVAEAFVGRPYRRYSSLAPNLIPRVVPRILHGTAAGQNCISTTMDAYAVARGERIWRVHNADDIARRQDLFAGPYWLPAQPMGGN